MSELGKVLEKRAERGAPRGGGAVVAAALEQVDERPRGRWKAPALLATAAVVLAALLIVRLVPTGTEHVNAGDPATGVTGAETVLVVGVDHRAASDGAPDFVRPYDLMLLRLNHDTGAAALLSLPGDIAMANGERLSTARQGGTDALATAVENLVKIPIDRYVEFDFAALSRLIDAFGGVSVNVGAPLRDEFTGLRLDAGCVQLDGDTAAKYVRSGHIQMNENGQWRSDPTADLGRIQREQALLNSAWAKAPARFANRDRTAAFEDAVATSATGDAAARRHTARFLVDLLSGTPVISMLTMPVTTATRGDAAVLEVSESDVAQVIQRFTDNQPGPAADRNFGNC